MNDFVMIPILCNTPESEKYADMGLNIEANEFRACYLRKSAIIGFYPKSTGNRCIIETISGLSLETDIEFRDLTKLLFE